MALLGKTLAVAFPDTLLEERSSLRDKTVKLGLVARTCAIYGVDVVEIFRDEGGRGELSLIKKVLEYLETPQYLRRRLFPLDESLRFAGLLPPLRIPSHKPRVRLDMLVPGDVREGVVSPDGTVDIGLETAATLVGGGPSGGRVTVRVESARPLTASILDRSKLDRYWGYSVEAKTPREVVEDPRFALRVATSRKGVHLASWMGELRRKVGDSPNVKLIFGSPSRGLFEIMGEQVLREASFVLNLFPDQKVETVRTEEALFAALALVNFIAAEKA